jgi:hypothetical protein
MTLQKKLTPLNNSGSGIPLSSEIENVTLLVLYWHDLIFVGLSAIPYTGTVVLFMGRTQYNTAQPVPYSKPKGLGMVWIRTQYGQLWKVRRVWIVFSINMC